MNKNNLNLLCQKNKWEVPVYSDIVDIQNWDTPFRGSVVVNGIAFDSEMMFKSKKMAYNDAAGVAFSYFTTLSRLLKATSEGCFPVGPEDNTIKIAFPDHSLLPINEPTPSNYVDSYLLCNKVRVNTSNPDTVVPKGQVVLPIGVGKWTIVSLESK